MIVMHMGFWVMLDKSIPYFNIILIRKYNTKYCEERLPKWFHYESFKSGDEVHWAEIETSVLEFSEESEAMKYFDREYLKYKKELSERCIFITTEEGQKVGTATAWWNTRNEIRVPSIHWVSIKPDYQNMGLGKSIVSKVIKTSIELDGDKDSFLHTQTWSYHAVGIYLQAGYKILRDGTFGKYQNDYEAALPYLKEKMGKRFSIERDTMTLS